VFAVGVEYLYRFSLTLACSPSRNQLLYRTAATWSALALKRSPAERTYGALLQPVRPGHLSLFPLEESQIKEEKSTKKLVLSLAAGLEGAPCVTTLVPFRAAVWRACQLT
jgi:hypothetical protein